MDLLYETQATAIGGRGGSAASVDGALRVKLSTPQALGGPGGDGTNPEQLFAAGYAACFLSAIKSVAAQEETDDRTPMRTSPQLSGSERVTTVRDCRSTSRSTSICRGSTAPRPNGSLRLPADCPFSAATRGNIGLRLRIA